ncbi:hypothetical protein PR202_ga15178 [Eleusine coracana subsp. coracana]|uniref:Kinesin motor domain-containing protein n=1 Tax=Eleusine coracana subsp. coracana TaxID=191504 RepID=A0AAV5CJI9_ELECO|nr:hypothetical protein PR202_ga15178 [Eleusine coracana subsp. coracana]
MSSAAAAATADGGAESLAERREERRRRSEAVAWLRALLAGSGIPLPLPGASDDELRAALADGALLRAAFGRLPSCPGPTPGEGAAAGSDVGRFVAAVERMGFPSFAASDLEKMEEGKIEERQLVDKDIVCLMKDKETFTRLTKDKEEMARLLKDKEDIIRLMKEKEEMVMLMKEKEDMVSLKKGRLDHTNQSADEHEDSKITILKLNLELESVKSSYEECHSLLESRKEDVIELLKDKDKSDTMISKLRQELAVSGKVHETHIQELKSRALQETEEFKQRIKELELMLEDSRKRGRDLEVLLRSEMENWKKKEAMVNQIVGMNSRTARKDGSKKLVGLGKSLKVLINDAENYHTALEENRKLFNEIQELKDDVFKDIQPLIRSVLDGYNVCIFAYGQTGSGKTYTMTGPENATEKEWGVNYRALNDLFHISRNRGDTIMYEVSAQMIEIYNEQVRDLLGSNGPEKRYPFFFFYLQELINPDVSSYSETLSTLKFAERVSGVELGAAKANKEGKDIRELMEQLSLLKHKIAMKDEEISKFQLPRTQTPKARTAKRVDSPLKHSSSSPGISSLGSKIQHRRTASGGKAMSISSRAFSDADNFSEISDRQSESGSMQSVDDTISQKGITGLPVLSIDEMAQNSADPDLSCFGYAESEERLRDISDSGLSMGTERLMVQ